MALKGPNAEDLRKIHSEVNQITNQRFLVMTLAITVFGVITAWLLPKSTPMAGQPVGAPVWVISVIHCLLLFALFFLQTLLKNTLRLFTTYLVVMEASPWEMDWKTFRGHRTYAAYGKPMTLVFLLLSIFAGFMPFLLAVAYELTLFPPAAMWVHIVIASLTVLLIFAIGFGGWLDNEKKVEDQWMALKAKS